MALLALAWTMAPDPAAAEWIVTPHVHVDWGAQVTFRDLGTSFGNEFGASVGAGGSAVWRRGGPVELEVDVSVTPSFFGNRIAEDDFEFGGSRLTTVMANARVEGWRFLGLDTYASGGGGLFHARIDDLDQQFEVSSLTFGINAGGGVVRRLNARFALQGDVRYFHSLQEKTSDNLLDVTLGRFRFWRVAAGVAVGF